MQGKRSFGEIAINEYKLIVFVVLVSGGLAALLYQVIDIIDYATGIENIEVIYQVIGSLDAISRIIKLVIIPPIIARALNGQRLKSSITGGLRDLKKLRTWKFIIGILVPYFMAYRFGSRLLGDSLIQKVVDLSVQYPVLTNLQYLQMGLYMAIKVMAASISLLIVIVYIVYMRGTSKIEDVFKAVPTSKIIILVAYFILMWFSLYEQIFGIGETLSYNMGWISYSIVMLIYNLALMYITVSLYISIANSIPTSILGSSQSNTGFGVSNGSDRNQMKDMREQQESQEPQVSSDSINSNTVVEEKQTRKVDNPFEVK